MALREISLDNQPEQLTFKAFELAEAVAHLIDIETKKKEANEDFNLRIKATKKQIAKLSAEIQSQRRE